MPARPLKIHIEREAYIPFFTLTLEDGQMLDLDPDEARAWCAQHGADSDAVENVLDYVWNFRRADFVIKNPIDTSPKKSKIDPLI